MAQDKVIRNGCVISMDPQIGILHDADVLVRDDKLVSVGHSLDIPAEAEVIDASGCIVMPGFIDSHRHVWQGPMRAVCTEWSLLDYIRGIRMNAAGMFQPEDMYAAQFHGALEALDSGVTTVADYCHNINTPDHAHEAIRGLRDAGLRTIWCYGFNTPPLENPVFSSQEDRITFARSLAQEYFTDDSDLLTLGLCPEEPIFWGGDERGVAQFHLAKDLGARVFWHCNSSSWGGKRTRDVARIETLGLLDANSTLVHLHCTDLDEWSMIAHAGAGVSFTPDTELQMGMSWPLSEVARSLNIPQSYGIDITSNNSADFFVCLRMALQTARCRENDRANGEQMVEGVPISTTEALAWGTIEAAKAIGMEDRIGSLTPGKQADIQLIRMNDLTTVGWDRSNPVGSVIMQAGARNVDTVLVGGRPVKRHGQMLADTGHACTLLSDANERVTERVSARGGYLLPTEEALRLAEDIAKN